MLLKLNKKDNCILNFAGLYLAQFNYPQQKVKGKPKP